MPKSIDITGQQFGELFVVKKRTDIKRRGRTVYECRCSCGNTHFSLPDQLKRQKVVSCGKCFVYKNLGKKYGRLTIDRWDCSHKQANYVWCKCECGNEKKMHLSLVVRGKIVSCGCKRSEVDNNKAIAKIGKKFHNLKVIRVFRKTNDTCNWLECKCKCGVIVFLRSGHFGYTKSCGCLKYKTMATGERAGNSRLKNSEAIAIREMSLSKLYETKDLQKMFGVSESAIRRILNNQTYKIKG